MKRSAVVLTVLVALAGCSKSAGRKMSYTTHGNKPVLEITCEPGDRIRVVRPTPSDERRCDGKEVRGAEVFPLNPGDFTLGHNSWSASVATPKGGTLTVTTEFDYKPTPEQVNKLFALAEPPGGADAVAMPPEVSAAFLPGAPHGQGAANGDDLRITLKAPAQTKIDVGGKTFTVESSKGVELHLPLEEILADKDLSAACGPLEVPAKVTRTDGIVHEGVFTVNKAAPRVLSPLGDEKAVVPAGSGKAHTALIVRDDGECWSIGQAKVRNVGIVVLMEQLRRDLAPCKEGKGKNAKESPRIALDLAMGAFDPRTGQRKGEKTMMAPAPDCKKTKGKELETFSNVDPKLIKKWVATLK